MQLLLFILTIIFLIIIIVETIILLKHKEKSSNPRDVITELVKIKDRNDLEIDKEHDDLVINNYLDIIKDILNKYDNSRSKQVAYRTRRILLYNLILVLPTMAKYTEINFEYDITSKIPLKRSDKDIMRLLKETYNSYSEESPEVFNDFILCTLLLNDNR